MEDRKGGLVELRATLRGICSMPLCSAHFESVCQLKFGSIPATGSHPSDEQSLLPAAFSEKPAAHCRRAPK